MTKPTESVADPGVARMVLPKSVLREYVDTIVVCVLILVFARSFVFMQSKIPTQSMLETLLVGDYILVNRFVFGADGDAVMPWLGQRHIDRQDVVVFRYPDNPDVDFVKRVIGLPGDTVQVAEGRLYVNGQALDEPYAQYELSGLRSSFGPIIVPPGEYFVLGDNRDNSRDSRAWGNVPRSLIKGRAFCIWFSYEEDPNDHLRTGAKRLYSIAKKVRYFFSRTRWSRFPSLIR